MCGKDLRMEPSLPTGDAPCPHCGHLVWLLPAAGSGVAWPSRRLPALSRVVVKGVFLVALLAVLFAAGYLVTGSVSRALIIVVIACLVFGKEPLSRTAFYVGRLSVAMRRRWYGV
jgi:hypothetical protein